MSSGLSELLRYPFVILAFFSVRDQYPGNEILPNYWKEMMMMLGGIESTNPEITIHYLRTELNEELMLGLGLATKLSIVCYKHGTLQKVLYPGNNLSISEILAPFS